ncbi:MAG TPA: hypothetical protein DGX96_01500 [Lachnospiraceae bacterium]|jgi:hypothetical protein|nr:hypothetical protein [Lachnospiraceae bacterium]
MSENGNDHAAVAYFEKEIRKNPSLIPAGRITKKVLWRSLFTPEDLQKAQTMLPEISDDVLDERGLSVDFVPPQDSIFTVTFRKFPRNEGETFSADDISCEADGTGFCAHAAAALLYLEKKYGHIVTVESSLNYAARTYKKFREQEIQRVKDLWTSMPQDPRPLTDFIITSLDVTDEEIRKRKEQQGQKVTGDHPEVRIPVNREESFNFDDLLRRYRTLAFSSAQFDDLINAMRDNRTNADGDAMTGADRYQYGRLTLDVKREDDTAGTLRYDFSLFLHDNLQVVRIRGSIENKEMVLFSEDIWDMSSAFLLTGDLPKQKTSYDLNGNVLLDGFAMMTIYMLRLKLQKGIEIPQQ